MTYGSDKGDGLCELGCDACAVNDRCKPCELVNGSTMVLCAPCRRRHEELISATPVGGPDDVRAEEALALGCEAGEPVGVDPCSCEESLALRDLLALAARGALAIHAVKGEGYWSIELWKDGAMVESCVGVAGIPEAMERIGEWLRN